MFLGYSSLVFPKNIPERIGYLTQSAVVFYRLQHGWHYVFRAASDNFYL
jgi:hypothetical protein